MIQICAQKYCFFLKKHSQIVQIDSQIVQKLILSVLLPILEGSKTGEVLENAVEGLVGRESAEGDSIGDGIVVRGIFGIAEQLLCMLHAVTGYKLGETETGAAVDTVGDVGAVGADSGRKVLNSEMRIGEELLLAQGGSNLIHQGIGLFGGRFVFLRLFERNGLFRQDRVGCDVTEAEEQHGHQDGRNENQQAAFKRIASEDIE